MKLNYLTLEIEKIENDIANGKSSLSYKERLIEFKAIKLALTIPVVVNCNCDESDQWKEVFEINHLINDTYQVVGKGSDIVWKQGTMEECNDFVML